MLHLAVLALAFQIAPPLAAQAREELAAWAPVEGTLLSRFAADVDPAAPLPEYPRPQLVRERWSNLNGLWDYAVVAGDPGVATRAGEARDIARPAAWDGQILVPFPLESALSGVGRRLAADECLIYRRGFDVPANWAGDRVLLHFGAVDWQAVVMVDGTAVGTHRGGYDPFHFDITDALRGDGPHELVVEVHDPTDAGPQPRGKQVSDPGGIWYTPSSGIWQTVWLEPVPEVHIGSAMIQTRVGRDAAATGEAPQVSGGVFGSINVIGPGGELMDEAEIRAGAYALFVSVGTQLGPDPHGLAAGMTMGAFAGSTDSPRLWSPEDPFLYDLEIELLRGGAVLDRVTGYVALRQVELRADESGRQRLWLNGVPYFQLGLLDQGFWPGGLYTAPTDEALAYDLEVTKQLGFNMARKHVKVEPDRWYYHADRLGVLVWQDIPSGDQYISPSDEDYERDLFAAKVFADEARAIFETKRWSASIVSWVIFNEGWGQHATESWAETFRRWDPDRIINSASGWTDRGVGDVLDLHAYPGPVSGDPGPGRAVVLGEFGGLGLPLEGHTWQDESNWGYRNFDDAEAATAAYEGLLARLSPLVTTGLAAAVYTQTTDVEIEVNGLMTYDRDVIKLDPARVRAANAAAFAAPTRIRQLVADARGPDAWAPTSAWSGPPPIWRMAGEAPPEGWQLPGFDDSGWTPAAAGLGSDFTPGGRARTDWPSDDIWARRSFELTAPELDLARAPGTTLALSIHYDEDAEVYLNGRLVASPRGYTTGYIALPLDADSAALLRAGTNHLAVTCRNTAGARYIDVGLALLMK